MPPRRAVTGRSQEPRQRYVEELRLLRAQKGDTLRQLGDVLGWDWSLFGKMESGQTLGSPEVVQALDQHYGTPGLLLTLWELAVADPTQFKERYRRYMTLEAEALSLWHYAVSALPGLLQTEAYAHDLLTAGGISGEELTRQVEARIGRHQLLDGDNAARFRSVVSEAVLRTPLEDAQEWRKQLEHLLDMGERRNIVIQVVRQEAGLHALTNTHAMFLRLPDGRTVAWVETGYSGELIEETAAVERLQLSYDLVRDLALTPAESRKFIRQLLEEASCEPST
ncbi:helix-turn-helix domain-containing protein [Streptomyces sp. Je 1-4]|uniref:helix-turn-helix domain-containing protein n=1 Tax=Streptomyces TaxID=1883 RepID=UPI0021DA6434|nr:MULTISPECIES: helix-turn-helix transcriptional regulator [unclassified Streptomyces]UYB41904.1 helix-turn-helix domain-containing protein [Streptomyces sp. Je 1-4]UZQ38172.1 helix-turn-helix domain-containing protein [Streptomyces sp. Je 1-4] [Streptomyces sp. Je 1-4 4N24]UZQ45589.1 helix-turn-helix domain-containing protein [Streptomyces sp. Je 1-4] [Streptomyces sp. Je 1-4 4N24_ara]